MNFCNYFAKVNFPGKKREADKNTVKQKKVFFHFLQGAVIFSLRWLPDMHLFFVGSGKGFCPGGFTKIGGVFESKQFFGLFQCFCIVVFMQCIIAAFDICLIAAVFCRRNYFFRDFAVFCSKLELYAVVAVLDRKFVRRIFCLKKYYAGMFVDFVFLNAVS